MPTQIENTKGNIFPFTFINVQSFTEAKEKGVVAHGEALFSADCEGAYYTYLGLVENLSQIPHTSGKLMGPVINYGKPVGDPKAIITCLNFKDEIPVYISNSKIGGSIELIDCAKIGVWQKVRSR